MRRPAAGLLAVLLLWAAALALVHPTGNFPLMDDWIYAFGVRSIVTDGAVRFSPYMEATGIAHLAWGSLFTAVPGFSFEWLRMSTLALAAMGIVTTWLLAREIGAGAGAAAFAAATFAFNPVALTLSGSFMTDVPFAVWTMGACFWMLRALVSPAWPAVAAGTVFAVVATLVRDQGLAWPLAFAAAALYRRPRSLRTVAMAGTPLIACAAMLIFYRWWLDATGRRPENVGIHVRQLIAVITGTSGDPWIVYPKNLLNVAFHLSWYAMPIVAFTAAAFTTRRWVRWLWAPAVAAVVLLSGRVAPWGSSVLYDFGIGPMMMRPWETGVSRAFIPAPRWLWQAVTIGAALTGAAIAIRVTASLRRQPDPRIVFLAAGIVTFMTPMVLTGFHDRYLISCITPAAALALLLSRSGGWTPMRAVAGVTLAAYALFGVCAAHDYFEWNRAKWAAIRQLQSTGRYRASDIDGGVEYAGWNGYHRKGVPLDLPDAIVIVALDPIAGTTVCSQVLWRRWMPPRHDTLWIVGVTPQACP